MIHFRCGAHTISLVAVTDYKNIIGAEPKAIKKLHLNAFAKCQQIWNGSRRPKGSGEIHKLIGKTIKYPVVVRWNSIPDCLMQLIRYYEADAEQGTAISNNMINQLLLATSSPNCNHSPFTQKEIDYLGEYLILMRPLTRGLDRLQSDKNGSAFFGFLLPILFSIKKKLELNPKNQNIKILSGIGLKLSIAFSKRFKSLLDLDYSCETTKFAVMASISHPQFKTRWLNTDQIYFARLLFSSEASKMQRPTENNDAKSADEDEYFDWMASSNDTTDEVSQYLDSSSNELEVLNSYPTVKQIFLKFNAPLCSSATIERVFNYGGMLDDAKRNRIAPKNLENNVIIKANQIFSLRNFETK